ncbi:hypothetical protein NQZ68_028917, partial [Dissostichus eleginoides]
MKMVSGFSFISLMMFVTSDTPVNLKLEQVQQPHDTKYVQRMKSNKSLLMEHNRNLSAEPFYNAS